MSIVESDKTESKTVNLDETNSSSTRPTDDSENDGKIVFLKAAGCAPILKKKKWALPRSKTIGHIVEFLKKIYVQLDVEQQKQLFLYVNQTFAAAFDTTIGAVNDCFNSEEILVLHYTLTPTWG